MHPPSLLAHLFGQELLLVKLEMSANSNSLFDGNLGGKVVIRDRAYGTSGLEVAASVDVNVDGFSKKVALSVEANEKGCMEITYGNGTNNKVSFYLHHLRKCIFPIFYVPPGAHLYTLKCQIQGALQIKGS